MKKQGKKPDRYPKNLKIIIVIIMTAILIITNMISILIVDKFNLKLDMTANKLYELSDTTHDVINALEEPINITIFSNQNDFVMMIKEVMCNYDSMSDKITVTYNDPYENPILVDSYKQKGFDIKQNDIIVEGKNRIRQYEIEDLYTFNSAKTNVTGIKVEQQITSALLHVNDTSVSTVRFTDGHNERPTTALMDIFKQNNFEVSRVTVNIMGIDEDTDVLVIASPTRDFENDEIKLLEEYMANGGKMMVFIEPAVNDLINLNNFVESHGIKIGDEVVFEKEAYISNNPINVVPMYAQHQINQYFGSNRYFLIMPSTRSLYKKDDISYDFDVKPLLIASPLSYGKKGINFATTQKEDIDSEGPFFLAMTSSRQVLNENEKEETARIFVAGSRSMYSDDILNMSSYANADFLIQTMNWLTESQTNINIPEKSISPDPINVLPKQAIIIGIVIMGIIPAVIFGFGIIVHFRRRNL